MMLAQSHVEAVLGRQVWEIDVTPALEALAAEKVLVTGARGSVGGAVVDVLEDAGVETISTDKDDLDVRDREAVMDRLYEWEPTLVLHLAAGKHAPIGERYPQETAATNIGGTQNVLEGAALSNARVILASTCKASNPETVYGATKLIAERMTLEAGGSVARFFNVVETCGNVFELWADLPEGSPIPVTPCGRYFLALREAVALMLYAATEPPGRYAVHPGRRPRVMSAVAGELYPDRPVEFINPRRGDRVTEPICAADEWMIPITEWLWRVESRHDGGNE